ncbi:MAG: aldo/keto reductase [Gallicola sp.]|nr:aldo/keto reductase [Gallicola sp.]
MLGENIKKLGFGLMRFKTIDGEFDLEMIKGMVDRFMEEGFTYFDTAWAYDKGYSEVIARKAIVERFPRESFQLATKLPAYSAESKEKAEEMFYTSLDRTQAGYFDFYLLHNLGGKRTEIFDRYDIWNFLKKKKEEGLIKNLGFSFHDKADVLDELLTAHPDMDFVQLQLNYIDWEDPTIESRKCYEVALKHNMPIIIMEPVKGGTLSDLPKEAAAIFKEADKDSSVSSWAIRYAASLKNVVTVLSGMSYPEQLEDNLKTMKNFLPLSEEERWTIKEVVKELHKNPRIPCTDCKYCVEGCPADIPIPDVLSALNREITFQNTESAKSNYNFNTDNTGKASDCIECGHCEEVCPQKIEIISWMKDASKKYDH